VCDVHERKSLFCTFSPHCGVMMICVFVNYVWDERKKKKMRAFVHVFVCVSHVIILFHKRSSLSWEHAFVSFSFASRKKKKNNSL
jgi:hypothetical protein